MLGELVIYLYEYGAGIVEVPAIVVEEPGDTVTLYVFEKSGLFVREGVERDDKAQRANTWHPKGA